MELNLASVMNRDMLMHDTHDFIRISVSRIELKCVAAEGAARKE